MFLATVDDRGSINIINLLDGLIFTLHATSQQSSPLAFLDDIQLVYINSANELAIYDLDKNISTILYSLSGRVTVLKSKDGLIAIAEGKHVLAVNLKGELVHLLKSCRSTISDMQFFHQSMRIAATRDRKIHIWDLADKKPKSAPISDLEAVGCKLSISDNDRLISVWMKLKYGRSNAAVYNLESMEALHKRVGEKISSDGILHALFFNNELLICDYNGINVFDTADFSLTETIEGEFGQIVTGSSDMVAISYYGQVISLINKGSLPLYQTPVKNLSQINFLFSWKDKLFTVGDNDIVSRTETGESDGRFASIDSPLTDVVRISFDDTVWLIGRHFAYLFDLVDWRVEAKTKWISMNNSTGSPVTALREKNRTMFVSSATQYMMGRITLWTDDGQELFDFKKANIHYVLAVWEVNGKSMIFGKAHRAMFDPVRVSINDRQDNANEHTGALVDAEKEKVYLYGIEDGSLHLRCVDLDLANENNPHWNLLLEGLSLIGWLEPGKSLLFSSYDGALQSLECSTQKMSMLNIKQSDVIETLLMEPGKLALGLSDGTVRVSYFTEIRC